MDVIKMCCCGSWLKMFELRWFRRLSSSMCAEHCARGVVKGALAKTSRRVWGWGFTWTASGRSVPHPATLTSPWAWRRLLGFSPAEESCALSVWPHSPSPSLGLPCGKGTGGVSDG